MKNKNQKFFFENNEISKKFSEFKKLKLLGDENKKEQERINKSEKESTSEEEINNLDEKLNKIIINNEEEENQIKEKSKIINKGNLNVKSNEKSDKEEMKVINEISNENNNNNIDVDKNENVNNNLNKFFPFDIEYIFQDFQEINDIEMDLLNKRKCNTLLKLLKKKKYCKYFLKPVVEILKEKEIKELYKKVIKKPMDLQTISNNLKNDNYNNIGDFLQDFSLIVTNAQNFNQKDCVVFKNAEKIKAFSQKYFKLSFNIEINMQKNRKRFLISPKKDFRKKNKKNEELLYKKRERNTEKIKEEKEIKNLSKDDKKIEEEKEIKNISKDDKKIEEEKEIKNISKDDKKIEEEKVEKKDDQDEKKENLFVREELRVKKIIKIALFIETFNDSQVNHLFTLLKSRNIINNYNLEDDCTIINLNNFPDKDLDITWKICKEVENEY